MVGARTGILLLALDDTGNSGNLLESRNRFTCANPAVRTFGKSIPRPSSLI